MLRYLRELRDDVSAIGRILVPAPGGVQVPLIQLADIEFSRGPDMIKSEDTFLVGYVLFDGREGFAEVDVVEEAYAFLAEKIQTGELDLPAGVSYTFAGTYEHQVRAQKTLRVVLPIALGIIFIILYFQFRTIPRTLLVFSGIATGFSGGFLMLWLYNQGWFLDFALFGVNLQTFSIHPYNLSVAVGWFPRTIHRHRRRVLMMTYLTQRLDNETLRRSKTSVRPSRPPIAARPAMTSATTIWQLCPC